MLLFYFFSYPSTLQGNVTVFPAPEHEERIIKMVNVVTDDDITKVKKPKRVLLKLDLDKLFSDRGLSAIPEHVNSMKFKGKGHELEDISKICKAYEHWAHRLYPKMRFKDVLEKVRCLCILALTVGWYY